LSSDYTMRVEGDRNSGAFAMGPRANAVVHNHGGGGAVPEELARLLDRLDALIDEYESHLDEPGKARRDAGDVRQEAADARPDRGRVLDALKRLSERAAEVTAIVEVTSRIRELFA